MEVENKSNIEIEDNQDNHIELRQSNSNQPVTPQSIRHVAGLSMVSVSSTQRLG